MLVTLQNLLEIPLSEIIAVQGFNHMCYARDSHYEGHTQYNKIYTEEQDVWENLIVKIK